MQEPDIPDNELDRLHAICGMRILDTPSEERFDRITRLAAHYFSVPSAIFTIVDTDRQWFKSKYGITMSETPRRVSFCGHVIYMQDTLIVKDALEDRRFYDNPLVIGGPKIRFYAGHPIYNSEGYVVGSLCLIDSKPRFFSEDDTKSLIDFAKLIERELQNKGLEIEAEVQSKQLDNAVQRLIKHIDNSPLAVLEWDKRFKLSKWSARAESIFGWKEDEVIGKTFLEWKFIHDEDIEAVTSSLGNMIQPQQQSVIIQNRNYTKNGNVVNCTWYNSILFDEHGEMSSVLSLVQDETARVTAETQLLQSNINLESRVQERTAELEEKQAMLDVILDSIEVGIVAADADGHLTLFNKATKRLHGIDKIDTPQESWAEYYKLLSLDGERLLETHEIPLSRALSGELVHNQEFMVESADGFRRIINASGQSFFDSLGQSLGAVVAMHDITEQKKIELELLAKQALLRSITDSIPAGVAYVDQDQRYQYCNQEYHRIYNKSKEDIVGKTKIDVFGSSVYKTLESFIKAALLGELVAFERQLIANDKVFHLDVRFIPDVTVTQEVQGFYVVVWDITEQKNRELEYKRQASMDPLTGVYNKSFIVDLLKQEIKKNNEANQHIAIMFLDIDYFKRINDNYGHLVGDEVIKFFAAKVKSVIRETDYIGRFGGDEFLVVLPAIRKLESVEKIADKILDTMQVPFKIGALTFQLSTSIGIGFSQHASCADLIKLADEAVYEAKAAGRGNYKSKQSE